MQRDVQGWGRGVSHRFGEGVACTCAAQSVIGGALSKPVAYSENLAHFASLALYTLLPQKWCNMTKICHLSMTSWQTRTGWNFRTPSYGFQAERLAEFTITTRGNHSLYAKTVSRIQNWAGGFLKWQFLREETAVTHRIYVIIHYLIVWKNITEQERKTSEREVARNVWKFSGNKRTTRKWTKIYLNIIE